MGACPWKYALGKPGEGVHASRMWGLATNDVLGTLAGVIVLALVIRHRVAFVLQLFHVF
jgi:hypothetical protein